MQYFPELECLLNFRLCLTSFVILLSLVQLDSPFLKNPKPNPKPRLAANLSRNEEPKSRLAANFSRNEDGSGSSPATANDRRDSSSNFAQGTNGHRRGSTNGSVGSEDSVADEGLAALRRQPSIRDRRKVTPLHVFHDPPANVVELQLRRVSTEVAVTWKFPVASSISQIRCYVA